MKWFTNKYVESFLISTFVGIVSASGVFFVMFPDHPDIRKLVSACGIAFLGPFAALSKALPDPLHPQPQVRAENVERMTVNPTTPPPVED